MKFFITGTDTNVGKTVISSWLCLHLKATYFKPIQTGLSEGSDSAFVSACANVPIHPEVFAYQAPVSPHLAARLENRPINLDKIKLPEAPRLILEGAGGVFVPLNEKALMVDLIEQLQLPVLLVSRTTLGTLNHTLLSLYALQERKIAIAGVILNGPPQNDTKETIEFYGKTKVLAEFPSLPIISTETLAKIPLPSEGLKS